MRSFRVIGIDPAFRALGWCCVEIDSHTERIESVGLVRTEKAKSQKVLVAEDNHECSRTLTNAVYGAIQAYKPHVICAESLVGSRSAKACTMQGMAWGIVSAVTTIADVPVVQVSPQKVKKVLTGYQTATKQEVEEAVCSRYPRLREIVNDINPPSQREHVFDAVGVVISCLASTEIMMFRNQCEPEVNSA